MYIDGKVWIGNNDQGERISIIPKMVNRHGLVAGATGTGKTVTLKVMAETFSDMGIPVFMADVKGDIAGMMNPGTDSEDMQKRIGKFNLTDAGFAYKGYPVTLWDIYGVKGIQLRTTISEMGPMLLARILDLNDLQSDILTVIFKIADDRKWFLIDTKDLKSVLNYVSDHRGLFEGEYGKMSPASISTIVRAVVALEAAGGNVFFGEPALRISDWLTLGDGGKGMINILDSESLINNGKMYSAFLLWMLSELFETLPEVGDLPKPKMVFFFDEAHLLFNGAPKQLLDKIEQVVKLIRSKGVGVYFCTQNPKDIPDGVLAQLGNKVQHGLHAYTRLCLSARILHLIRKKRLLLSGRERRLFLSLGKTVSRAWRRRYLFFRRSAVWAVLGTGSGSSPLSQVFFTVNMRKGRIRNRLMRY